MAYRILKFIGKGFAFHPSNNLSSWKEISTETFKDKAIEVANKQNGITAVVDIYDGKTVYEKQ